MGYDNSALFELSSMTNLCVFKGTTNNILNEVPSDYNTGDILVSSTDGSVYVMMDDKWETISSGTTDTCCYDEPKRVKIHTKTNCPCCGAPVTDGEYCEFCGVPYIDYEYI